MGKKKKKKKSWNHISRGILAVAVYLVEIPFFLFLSFKTRCIGQRSR